MAGMTKQEVIDSLDDAINRDRRTLIPRVFVGALIHAKKYLEESEPVTRCKYCKWYDPLTSLCDNCGLPREEMFFCADGKRREFADQDTAQHGDQDVLTPAT